MKLIEREVIKLKGRWHFAFYEGDVEYDTEVNDPDRRVLNPVVLEAVYDNLITTVGKQQVLDRLYGLSAVIALANTGVGTGSTAAAIGDTALTGGVFKVYDATPVRTSLTVKSTTTYTTSEANINIQEAALTTASPGILFNRLAPIGPFNKTTAVSLAVTVDVTQA